MLINHRNFHFAKITDKTNDVIFLKSPETNEPILRKLTHRQKNGQKETQKTNLRIDGRMDRQTYL